MVLGGGNSHPAGGYKDMWRPHEYYQQMGDTMYEPSWIEKDIKTWRQTTKPIGTIMPGSQTANTLRRAQATAQGRSPSSPSLSRSFGRQQGGSLSRPGSGSGIRASTGGSGRPLEQTADSWNAGQPQSPAASSRRSDTNRSQSCSRLPQ
mmetsp:Transcript_36921/g.83487  ORF Transcript_36921/g.83487 Transcript_36921/m.83487 type:complete len:149 (+) Transcript_36921:102-548(+)